MKSFVVIDHDSFGARVTATSPMALFQYKGNLRRVTGESKESLSDTVSDSGDSFSTVATSVRNRCPLSSQESTALKDVLSKRLSSAGSLDDLVAPEDSASQPGSPFSYTTTVPLVSLTADDVTTLLHSIDLSRYSAGFRELPWRGADLEVASDDDLNDAGVSAAVHRRSLLRQIEAWREHGVPKHLINNKSEGDGYFLVELPPAPPPRKRYNAREQESIHDLNMPTPPRRSKYHAPPIITRENSPRSIMAVAEKDLAAAETAMAEEAAVMAAEAAAKVEELQLAAVRAAETAAAELRAAQAVAEAAKVKAEEAEAARVIAATREAALVNYSLQRSRNRVSIEP